MGWKDISRADSMSRARDIPLPLTFYTPAAYILHTLIPIDVHC